MKDGLAARFLIKPDNVSLLRSPSQFKHELEQGVETAQRRCGIVSLYVGAEQDAFIRKLATRAARDGLKTFCVLDYCRTLRPERQKSGPPLAAAAVFNEVCRSLLAEGGTGEGRNAPQIPGFSVSLYHTPPPYWWIRLFPFRMQETLGVLHWKFYIFDDSVIITGANVSSSYLTDRHDRWILIKNEPALCDVLTKIAEALMPGTHQLYVGPDTFVCAEPVSPLENVWTNIEHVLQSHQEFEDDDQIVPTDSVRIHVGIHCGYAPKSSPISNTEPSFLGRSLQGMGEMDGENPSVVLASPYLNLAPETVALLQAKTRNQSLHIVGPSPGASSFFNGGPVLSAIPFAYLRLTTGALKQLTEKLKVYYTAFLVQKGETFHAKGIWNLGRNQDGSKRMLTLAGSSNFSIRSQRRDLECLFLIDTAAPSLVAAFEEEVTAIRSTSKTNISWQVLRQGICNAKWPARLLAKFFATNGFFKSLL